VFESGNEVGAINYNGPAIKGVSVAERMEAGK